MSQDADIIMDEERRLDVSRRTFKRPITTERGRIGSQFGL
jgi:hypothetical protein